MAPSLPLPSVLARIYRCSIWNLSLDWLQQLPPQVVAVDNGPRIAELAKQVSDLKETVNILISQIQMLRSEVKSRYGSH